MSIKINNETICIKGETIKFYIYFFLLLLKMDIEKNIYGQSSAIFYHPSNVMKYKSDDAFSFFR